MWRPTEDRAIVVLLVFFLLYIVGFEHLEKVVQNLISNNFLIVCSVRILLVKLLPWKLWSLDTGQMSDILTEHTLASYSLPLKIVCMLLLLGKSSQNQSPIYFWRTFVFTKCSNFIFKKNGMMKQTVRTSYHFFKKINWIKNLQQAPCFPFLA